MAEAMEGNWIKGCIFLLTMFTSWLSYKYYRLLLTSLLLIPLIALSQHLAFQHRTVKDGLSAFTLACTCFDKNGSIWVGTNDGLNKYDGYSVTQYFKETHPQLPANEIGYLFCDSRNRIWICTNYGLGMLDENRVLKNIAISDTLKKFDTHICFEAPGFGIVVVTNKGNFYLKEADSSWKPYALFNSIFTGNVPRAISFLNKDTALIVAGGEKAVVVDFKKQRAIMEYKLDHLFTAAFINSNEILVGASNRWNLQRINITTGKMLQSYKGILNQQNEIIETGIFHMQRASDKNIYISTVRNGLLKFNPDSNVFENYMHSPLDENSIGSNSPRWIAADKNGNIAITSNKELSLTNINYSMMETVYSFKTNTGKIIDEEVYDIIEVGEKEFWVATTEYLLRTNLVTKETTIIRDLRKDFLQTTNYPRPTTLEKDNSGNIWVGFSGEGIIIYKKSGGIFKKLNTQTGLPVDNIRIIKKLPDGNMMVGAERRLFKINSRNYSIDSFANDIPLQKIARKRIIDILPDGDKTWIAASPNGGAYCYNFTTKQIKSFTHENGLPSDRIYCLEKDRSGNIYIGGYGGISILLPGGSIKNFNKSNGLISTRVENILADDSGNIWFTNNTNITKYTPADHSFTYFDEHNGLNVFSYAISSNYKTNDGSLIFGNKQGLVFFNPAAIKNYSGLLQLFIHYTEDGKDFIPTDSSKQMEYGYNEGKINFSISSSDLLSNQKILYSYKMMGLDTGWSAPTLNRTIMYNLRPGKYSFTVRASYNGRDWIASSLPVFINVKFPFWQKLWFIILSALLITGVIFLFYNNRVKNIKQNALVRQQITELEAKALRAQMNPHFIFNSLNAIQELIITNNTDEGYRYLSSFSKLLRMVLNNSEKNFISLTNELEMIKLYLSLESLRFRQSFSYEIMVDENLEPDIVQVPSLLLQPYVENAVWHGLRHKDGEKKLLVRINEKLQLLEIEIDDNGVGRKRSEQIKNQKLGAEQFESKGTALAQQRITLLNQQYPGMANTTIIDKTDTDGNASGTKVIISLPVNIKN